MLDEMTAFMILVGYKKESSPKSMPSLLSCYKDLITNDDPENLEKTLPLVPCGGSSPIPANFINETQCMWCMQAKGRPQPSAAPWEIVPKRPWSTHPKNDVLKAIRALLLSEHQESTVPVVPRGL